MKKYEDDEIKSNELRIKLMFMKVHLHINNRSAHHQISLETVSTR